ncbi:hypothetical protein O1611_g2263 [Lasiodiplodia mahajangana]|uniref:Uncharacterized protein n=1 Tax=Lasiodiplodia mahajangana TaxID=1108764 RepID=A0ACC2JV81_9PEZI|nr:hypothetical protein O1611_g2263 [Lasiodiplodia mahajangana]
MKPKGDVPDIAKGESLAAHSNAEILLSHDVEGLTTLWDLLPLPEPQQDNLPSKGQAPVDLDVVVVHGFFGAQQSPWQNPGAGSSEWLHSWRNRDCRVMNFNYDATNFLSGVHTRKCIRRLAIKLLDDLQGARQESKQKRNILFVAHDLGGIIVKDALMVSGLRSTPYAEIFDFTRVLVFYGCPHRSLNDDEMEDKLTRFLYRSCSPDESNLPLLGQSMTALARAVIDINQLYIDSKHTLQCYILSIYAESDTTVDKVFDHLTSTMGVPFEVRFACGSEGDRNNVENRVSRIISLAKANIDSMVNERTLLSAASPLSTLISGPGPSHPFSWISNNSQYKSWHNQRNPQLLYLYGNSDTQSAAEYIFYDLDNLYRETNGQVVVYFSFDRYDNRRDSIQHMLATIQAQMLGHFPVLNDTFKSQLDQHRYDRSLHITDLLYWFEEYKCRGEVEGISCVLNHLDECEPTSRDLFLNHLRYISQSQERPFRFIITSRQPGALLEELSNWPALDLDSSTYQLNQNSSTVSYGFLRRIHSNVRGFRNAFEKEIHSIDELETDVRNLILQHIAQDERWPSEISIRDMFGSLQEITLESVICKILNDVPDKSFVLQVLTLILYAVRPPTVWELGAFTHIVTHDNSSDLSTWVGLTNDIRDKLQVWLAGIVTLSQTEAFISSRRIREALLAELSNTSGQHYMAGCLAPKVAHAKLAKYCLRYLSSETAKNGLAKVHAMTRNANLHLAMFCDRTSMLDYATQFWVHHFALSLDSQLCDGGLTAELESFNESGIVLSWSKARWSLGNPFTRSQQPAESLYPILAGAGLAAQAVVWCRGDGDLSTAIVEASFNGSVQTVRSLLPRARYSVDTLQETLIGAGSYGDEATWVGLVTNIHEKYPDFPWGTQARLVRRASWLGQVKALRKLLEVGCPADERDQRGEWGHTPLRLAVYMNNVNVAKVLLQYGADPKQISDGGRTLIHSASIMGNVDIIKLLSDRGADLDATDDLFATAMYHACLRSNYKVVEALISLGADPNIKTTKNQDKPAWSPLTCAIAEEHIDCAHAILNTRVNINTLGVHGVPLRYAVNQGLLGICQKLLASDEVDPNYHPLSPPMLVQAAISSKSGNRFNIIKLLIEKGANVDEADIYKQTALWCTCFSDDSQMLATVALLLEHKADVNSQTKNGSSPLHVAVSQRNVKLLELLVKQDEVNLDILNGNNETPLILACASEELARVLLEAGANPNTQPGSIYEPLAEAIKRGSESVVKLLVRHGARIEPPENLRGEWYLEPMVLALRRGRSDIVRILADGGANVNRVFDSGHSLVHTALNSDALGALLEFRPKLDVQDKYGYGPLHAVNGDTSVENVKLLIRAGANINLVSNNNTTPLIEALLEGNEEVANYLLSKNASTSIISRAHGGALHVACSSGMVGIVKRLIGRGMDVNMVVDGSGSPLSALFNDFSGRGTTPEMQTNVLDVLIEAGADVTIPTGLTFGTVGVAAAWSGTDEHISKLISKGTSFVAKDSMGRQPLHIAAVRGDTEIFTVILNVSHGPIERDHCGRSIVSWAAQGGNIEILEKASRLIGDKSINEKDKMGWTPLCWAARGMGVNSVMHLRYDSTQNVTPTIDDEKAVIMALLKKGADNSVKSEIKGKEYTPEGIATYHNRDKSIIELLAPRGSNSTSPGEKRLRETGGTCCFCLFCCWGIRYDCKTCGDFLLCYKCYESKHKIHPLSHEFKEFGVEFEPSSEILPSRHSSPSHSTTDDSSSSDSSSEDESEDEA